jgi:hypothetical protein
VGSAIRNYANEFTVENIDCAFPFLSQFKGPGEENNNSEMHRGEIA